MENKMDEIKEDTFEDIAPAFRHVVKEHGRELFGFVWNTGMATEAVQRIMQFAQKHQSRATLGDVQLLAQAYNTVATMYVSAKGWTQEDIRSCDEAIKRAFALSGDTNGNVIQIH